MEGLNKNYDYETWLQNGAKAEHLITIAKGDHYCGLDPQFTHELTRIGHLGRTYNAIDIDRTDNSNATVYTILDEMNLPLMKPNVITPGWGTNLHKERTVFEAPIDIYNQIKDQIDHYNRLSPLEEAQLWMNFLR